VANSRVEQHVEKGNDDGLYISSVACCQELWALIMDAGTGFSAQVPAAICRAILCLLVADDALRRVVAFGISLLQLCPKGGQSEIAACCV